MTSPNLSLYGITEELNALQELIALEHGELTPEIEEMTLRVYEMVEKKTDNIVGFHDFLVDEIALADERIKQLTDFKKIRKNAIERLKGFAADAMDNAGTKVFKGSLKQISEKKPTKVLQILDEKKIPVQFLDQKTVITIDKTKLKNAIKNNEIEIEGVSLVDGKRSIQFKNKTLK